jgi:tyrosine-protein kinase Etk/Wzc
MRQFVTHQNPEYQRAEEELSSLKAELSRLQNGRADSAPADAGASQRGLDNIKILRDVKYYQMLYELLAKQYEAARLDEAKDAAIIQVLDRAVEPEHKARPKVLIMIILWTAIAAAVAIALALLLDLQERFVQTDAGARQWAELKERMRLRPAKRVT